MFDFNKEDYMKFNTTMADEMNMNMTTISRKQICTRNKVDFLETFIDNYDGFISSEDTGPVYCDTLNGKLVPVPETMEDYRRLRSYADTYFAKKKHNSLVFMTGGYTFSPEVTYPDLGYPPGGYYQEIRELKTGRLFTPSEEVKRTTLYFKEHMAYQKVEKLCLMLGYHNNPTHEAVWQNCKEAWGGNPHKVCLFERQILVKLAGLCSIAGVDKSFILMEPEPKPSDKFGWMGMRVGTFAGRCLASK